MPDYSIIYETSQGQFKTVVPGRNGLDAEEKLKKKAIQYPVTRIISVNVHEEKSCEFGLDSLKEIFGFKD